MLRFRSEHRLCLITPAPLTVKPHNKTWKRRRRNGRSTREAWRARRASRETNDTKKGDLG